MDKDLKKCLKLTQDEKGKLHGGFVLQTKAQVESQFCSDNGNCKGGGWFDDNVNCSRCSACDKLEGMDHVGSL